MSETRQQYAERLAVEKGIDVLTDAQVLLVYHALEHAKDSSGYSQVFKDTIEDRAIAILNSTRKVEGTTAEKFYTKLDKKHSSAEYANDVAVSIEQANTETVKQQGLINYVRENYAQMVDEYNTAASIFAKETGTDVLTLEQFSAEYEYGKRPEYVQEVLDKLKSETISEAALDAYKIMRDIEQTLAESSRIEGHELGAPGIADPDSEEKNASGTGGTFDEFAGIGRAEAGTLTEGYTAIGAGGSGNGSGSGDGDGDGDGGGGGGSDGGSGQTTVGHVNKDGSPIGTAEVPSTNTKLEKDSIAAYAQQVAGDVAINHIFHNSFYQNEPIPYWAFSVDFIPTSKPADMVAEDWLYSAGRTLTKAVLTVKVPERKVKSVVSNYKGMSIELASRAVTAGTLSMSFAENDQFLTSTILNALFQYARSDTYFENVDNELTGTYKNAEEFLKKSQILRAYRRALPTGGHLYNILVKLYRKKDTKALDDVDSLEYPTFVYFFKGCDLKSVKPIEFDYDNDKPIDVSCDWVYQYYEELTFDEYLQRYGSAADDTLLEEQADQIDKQGESATETETTNTNTTTPKDELNPPNAQDAMNKLMEDFKGTKYWQNLEKSLPTEQNAARNADIARTRQDLSNMSQSLGSRSNPSEYYAQQAAAQYGRRR